MTTNSRAGFFQIMRNESFRKLWVGQLISQFGDGFYWLAIMLGVSAITNKSVQAIGFVSMAFMLPQLPIGLFGSPIVDRVNRRKLMILADSLRVVTTLLFIPAYKFGWLPGIYLLAMLQSSIAGFFIPAKNALIPQIVLREDLLSANTVSQATQVGALIFGPATAGFAIQHFGLDIAFVVDAVTFALSAIFVLAMDPVPNVNESASSLRQSWLDLKEGLGFIVSNKTLVTLSLTVGALFLGLGAVNVLWVPYMQIVFNLGAQKIGMIDAVQGVGMLLGTLLMGVGFVRNQKEKWLLVVGILVVSVSFAGIGVAPNYTFILVATVIAGIAAVPAEGSFMTIIQKITPDQLMGRINGTIGGFINGAMLVSMALAPLVANLLGLRESYVACGLIGFVAALLGAVIIEEV
jgi:DHA3 family macrolide efflux protein-like MFS transporter